MLKLKEATNLMANMQCEGKDQPAINVYCNVSVYTTSVQVQITNMAELYDNMTEYRKDLHEFIDALCDHVSNMDRGILGSYEDECPSGACDISHHLH